jgi:radical SAM superfamily enzyme YgiQ (UPF0313 family)
MLMNVLLVSTYELGRQPFGIASPAAVLYGAGHEVTCLDLSVQRLDRATVERAELIAFYLPMHTATRIALAALGNVRRWNPTAHLCGYGLYAPAGSEALRERGVQTILGGEFEPGLLQLATWLVRRQVMDAAATGGAEEESGGRRLQVGAPRAAPEISLQRQQFLVPQRTGLPPLDEYAHLIAADGSRRTVGYTEASRGCKHLCRHCAVVPVYEGRFRLVQSDVVLADIAQQVAMGAQHITFGDPDFFNAPNHAVDIIRDLHERHPQLTYDVTVKVEHLLRHAELLETLRDTGCAFVTSAVESVDDAVLDKLDKGHTVADFERLVELSREVGLALQPMFVTFTPWITLEGYEELLATIARLGLIENVPSIQLAIRLLIPAGSRLLELEEVRQITGALDPVMLAHPWRHEDRRVDALQRDIEGLIEEGGEDAERHTLFAGAWDLLQSALGRSQPATPPVPPGRARATIPYLSEPWYC